MRTKVRVRVYFVEIVCVCVLNEIGNDYWYFENHGFLTVQCSMKH